MKKFLLLFFILSLYPGLILAQDRVEINTASLSQLETLSGIGGVKAQAIIDSRPYLSLDDLLKVKGIGDKTLQDIKDQGLAYVSGAVQDTAAKETQAQEPAKAPQVSSSPVLYPGGIIINEIMPNPEGADETDEWVELYNTNSFTVNLSGWKLSDTTGTIKTYTILSGTEITANGFLVLKRPATKIMLNNDGDGLVLSKPDGKTTDSVNFGKAPLGQSYGKTASGWAWSTAPTPGAKNITSAGRDNATDLPKSQKSDNNNIAEAGLSDAGKNLISSQEGSHPWFLFFTVLVVIIILSAAVLLIKIKFNQSNVRT